METFSALLALWPGNSPVTGEFPLQRPLTRRFDVFLDLRLNKRLSTQSWGWWFETPSRSLWRHCNDIISPSSYLLFNWLFRLLARKTSKFMEFRFIRVTSEVLSSKLLFHERQLNSFNFWKKNAICYYTNITCHESGTVEIRDPTESLKWKLEQMIITRFDFYEFHCLSLTVTKKWNMTRKYL